MKLSDFDYSLPRELIAQYPASSRELSRMLVVDRNKKTVHHRDFKDLPSHIKDGDVLVLNDTRVINARLIGRRATGGKVEIFLTENIGGGKFKTLLRPSAKIKEGEEIIFGNTELKARLLKKKIKDNIVEFSPISNDFEKVLENTGNTPLPPYIKRPPEPLDSQRYQTVYARKKGATAAPTAGLHFTEDVLKDLESKGAELTYVTLHVNYSTFVPVKTDDIADHKMYSEDFSLTPESTATINGAKEKAKRVIAVGTTSCRVLETCAVQVTRSPGHQVTGYKVEARKGKTDLFIYPGYKFKIVDALLTNFHLPKSTLLLLVCAFAGEELIFKAYEEAIAKRYRFFSYGDCMLIL